MTYFLTSSHCVEGAPLLNPANGLVDTLHRVLPNPCNALFVCSDGDDPDFTDRIAWESKEIFETEGFEFTSYEVLDRRNGDQADELVHNADFIILAGGHVPTQNRFFRDVSLREIMADYDGIVFGISAGSMNSADNVYAQPELQGEAADPHYRRYLPGLNITKTMILPHYQMVKDKVIDGQHLFQHIAKTDSMGRCFYAMVDGTYVFGENGVEELRGEAYRIQDGLLEQISEEGDRIQLFSNNE